MGLPQGYGGTDSDSKTARDSYLPVFKRHSNQRSGCGDIHQGYQIHSPATAGTWIPNKFPKESSHPIQEPDPLETQDKHFVGSKFLLPEEKQAKIVKTTSEVCKQTVAGLMHLSHVLSLLISAINLVPWARSHTRPLPH